MLVYKEQYSVQNRSIEINNAHFTLLRAYDTALIHNKQ